MPGLVDLVRSFGVTFRHLFHRPITVPYPEVRREAVTRVRWRHRLLRHENGLERCVGCSLCVVACPSRCIHVEAAENSEEERHSPGERYAEVFEINMLRCVFCGLCEIACPENAIVLREDFELSDEAPANFLYAKDRLTVPLNEAINEIGEVERRNES
jgi:NADH-quinone oxidoreductase subunit I